MTRNLLLLLAGGFAASSLTGCPAVYFQTDGGVFEYRSDAVAAEADDDDSAAGDDDDSAAVELPGIYADPWQGFRNAGPVLAGTTVPMRLQPASGSGLTGNEWPGCYTVTWTGPVTVDGDLHTFDEGVSSVAIEPIESKDCLPADESIEMLPDAASVTAVTPADLTLEILRVAELGASRAAAPGAEVPWPEDWPAPFEAPLRVVAGEPVLLYAALLHPDSPTAVTFNSDDAGFALEAVDGAPPEEVGYTDPDVPDPENRPFSPHARFVLEEGASARLSLTIGDDTWTTGEIVGVPASDIVSLQVIPAYSPPAEVEEGGEEAEDTLGLPGTPLGARALALDADGNEILGAAVDWSVGGTTIQLVPGTQPGPVSYFPMSGEDYVWLYDGCLPPHQGSGERRSTLKASLGDLSDKATLHWWRPQGQPDANYERPEHCTGGCACDSAGGDGSAGLLGAAFFVLAGALRRRRRGRSIAGAVAG